MRLSPSINNTRTFVIFFKFLCRIRLNKSLCLQLKKASLRLFLLTVSFLNIIFTVSRCFLNPLGSQETHIYHKIFKFSLKIRRKNYFNILPKIQHNMSLIIRTNSRLFCFWHRVIVTHHLNNKNFLTFTRANILNTSNFLDSFK